MPSMQHEGLVLLFRNQPSLAPELLARVLGLRLPAHREARAEDVTLSQVAPAEFRADAVVVLHADHPVLAIVVEAQLSCDDAKRYSWPVYATTLRARHRCGVVVLVVAPDPGVAAWAARPIEIGPGSTVRPVVIGPDQVPRVTSPDHARRSPELAVLAVLAHGRGERALEVAMPALDAATRLDAERATLYADLVLSALEPAARSALEEMMKTGYQFQSDFAKKYFGLGRDEGLEKGLEQGREVGMRAVILRLLGRLGVELDEPTAARLANAPVTALERIADELATVTRDPAAARDAVRRALA